MRAIKSANLLSKQKYLKGWALISQNQKYAQLDGVIFYIVFVQLYKKE